MILYSVTVSVDKEIEADWLQWMRAHHIPDVLSTGLFSAWEFRRLLEPAPEKGLATYNIQYTCSSRETFDEYQEKYAPALQADHNSRYENRYVAFRTILELI